MHDFFKMSLHCGLISSYCFIIISTFIASHIDFLKIDDAIVTITNSYDVIENHNHLLMATFFNVNFQLQQHIKIGIIDFIIIQIYYYCN